MKKNVFKWILTKLKRAIPGILILTVLSIIMAFVSLSFSLVSKDALDTALSGSGSVKHIFIQLSILLLVQLTAQTITTLMSVSVNSGAEMSMRRSLFSELMHKDYLSVTQYHSAELINRLNSDVSIICGFAVNIVPALTMFLTKIVAGIVMLFMLDRVFAAAAVIFMPLMLMFAALYKKKFKDLHMKCQKTDGRTRGFMQEVLQNLLVVKSFLAEKNMTAMGDRLQMENFRYRFKRAVVSVLANVGMFLVFNAGYYFALAWGAYRVQCGIITAGSVFAIVTLIGQIQSPLKEMSSVIPQFYSMWASAERLIELEQLRDDRPKKTHIDYAGIRSIVLDHVSFSYSGDAGIEDVCAIIPRGGITAVAGESGAGKSTAMKLMLGIMKPDSGRIYFDTADGNIAADSKTRGMFAYVPQGNMLLSGTIRENIAFAKRDASEVSIIEAAKTACIWDFIQSLDDGLDTRVGEKGVGLSEGQIQRLAIARAVMYGAPILVFDEATSALDEATEKAVLDNIRALSGRMCIIITHRSTVIEACDNVIYIS